MAETEYAAWKEAAEAGEDLDEIFPEGEGTSPKMFYILDEDSDGTDYVLFEFSDGSVLVLSDFGQTGELDLKGKAFPSTKEADGYIREVVGGGYSLLED